MSTHENTKVTDQLVQRIAEEVLKRLKAMMLQKNALILHSKEADPKILGVLIETLETEGFRCVNAYPEGTESSTADMAAYDCLVIGDLSVDELCKIRDLEISGLKLRACYEALRTGKTVYALSRDMDIHKDRAGLITAADKLIAAVERLGVKMILKKRRGWHIDKSVISLTDVVNLKDKAVCLRHDAVVTTSAKQYLEEHQIVILRK